VISERCIECLRQRVDNVAGHQTGRLVRQICGDAMRGRRGGGSESRLHPLGQERGHYPREYVAAAGSREPGGVDCPHEHAVPRCSDQRVCPLQKDDAVIALDCLFERSEPVRIDPARVLSYQASELAGVRRQDGRRVPLERLQLEERVRVDDRRQLGLREQPTDELSLVAAQARTEGQRARALRGLEHIFERALHGLDDESLQNRE
jgi:hypothetical protein